MMKARLMHLEQRARAAAGEPLTVLYQTTDGEYQGTVEEMLQRDGYFIRVLSGSRLDDIDRILEAFLAEAGRDESGTA